MFLSTDYLNLPFEIRGLSVSQPCGESEIEFEKEFGIARRLEEPKGKRVFLIESSKRFQVIGKDVGGGSNSSTRTFITTLVAFAQKETETGVEPVRDINLLRRNLRAEKKQQTR
jgi:hypothetical protein